MAKAITQRVVFKGISTGTMYSMYLDPRPMPIFRADLQTGLGTDGQAFTENPGRNT
jgi:hypothetical protein